MITQDPINLEQILFERNQAYAQQDFSKSDELRSILNQHNIFVFDHPDGTQEVHFFPNKVPISVKDFEAKLKLERQAEKEFDAWLFSMNNELEI